ncbi:hypothetical protein H0H92_005322 [Tricholoma furcatifolium]|nr:hypothetical protein H0H92_005322 [Tricholoma furcatifolium]
MPHGFDPSNFHGYFATYTVENHSKFAEGVVIFLKYVVRWGGNNLLGLAVGAQNQTLSDFYNDSSSWASSGSTTASITVPAGSNTTTTPQTPVNCNTPALSGVSNDLYYFDVIIGTPASTN